MLEIFNRGIAGEPALIIDPVDGFPLVKALRGAWYYPVDKFGKVSRDLPKNPITPTKTSAMHSAISLVALHQATREPNP